MKLRTTNDRVIKKINRYLDQIQRAESGSSDRRRLFYELFSYLATLEVKNFVYKHPNLLCTIRNKLLYLVVIDKWTIGRKFYKDFELNSLIESSYIIGTFTGIDIFC